MLIELVDGPDYSPRPVVPGKPAAITTKIAGKEKSEKIVVQYGLGKSNNLFFRVKNVNEKVSPKFKETVAAVNDPQLKAFDHTLTIVRGEGEELIQAFVFMRVLDANGDPLARKFLIKLQVS